MRLLRATLSAALLVSTIPLAARVISYSPYTNRAAIPAVQSRTDRHFVLFENQQQTQMGAIAPMPLAYPTGQLVLYDSTGAEEPSVVLPKDGSMASFTAFAMRETNGVPVILAQTTADADGSNPTKAFAWFLSTDAGATWKRVALPAPTIYMNASGFDVGGPFVHSRYSPIRIGNASTPFVVATWDNSTSPSVPTVYAVDADGKARRLIAPVLTGTSLIGQDASGSRFLVRTAQDKLAMVGVDGTIARTMDIDAQSYLEGWITPDGAAYVEEHSGNSITVSRLQGGSRNAVVTKAPATTALDLFAVPTADYSGAWIVQRGGGKPTLLSLHDGTTLTQQWQDITAPEVEAIHTAASGQLLLIQVHRPRPQDNRLFLDPALAFWKPGDPAPKAYDELFMNEQINKAFVHLDVEKAATGDPFVFDSGSQAMNSGVPISPSVPGAGGGGDVVQEWGVVRASFRQKLVLPGLSRVYGAFGSFWQTDVIFYNPADAEQKVRLTYVPTGEVTIAANLVLQTVITLQPHEIRLFSDALKSLFGLLTGGGALLIAPESSVNVTSRTYSTSPEGTYGFGMNGIDYFAAAASPRFPVSFSGAFPGPDFRTNLILTDVSGRGSDASTSAVGFLGAIGKSGISFGVQPGGQRQYNAISIDLGLSPGDTGALIVQPKRGETIASVVAIDNRTNDATYFPPDLPSPIVRTIPAIGHTTGVGGTQYRSDLYMYNPSTTTRNVTLQWRMWDTGETGITYFTMLPGEARVIPDALQRLFGKSGIARLRYVSASDSSGVRITSRTYAVRDDGGTFGFLMPPLNNFQTAGAGESLEILGVVGGKNYRTNIGLVDVSNTPASQPAAAQIDIIDGSGKTIDSFRIDFPSAGGTQLNDIFHARNLGDGPEAALIRVSPISGIIGAYATLNDNGTNDPTYLAANLAARQ